VNVIKERYNNLDALRAISCLAIIGMHIKANTIFDNTLPGLGANIISSFTHFVPLFLIISGFGMFCGYYERIKNRAIDINSFYSRRYAKILPFFMFLMVIDVLITRSEEHIVEAMTQATLVFGLVPNNQPDVIGVSWTLGVIFIFYLLFPFFVFCFWNRKRALYTFVISFLLSIFCTEYYFTEKFVIATFAPRHNFLYNAPFFAGGGIIFLFRLEIKKIVSKYKYCCLLICVLATIGWFVTPSHIGNIDILMMKNLFLFSLWLCCAISLPTNILDNKVMHYLGAISLELYLAQMVIFRGIEKIGILYLCGKGWLGFLYAWIVVVVGLVVFIEIWKYIISNYSWKVKKNKSSI